MKKLILIIVLSILTITKQSFGEGPNGGDRVVYYAYCLPNIYINILNIRQISLKIPYERKIPKIGLFFGAAQLGLGFALIHEYNYVAPDIPYSWIGLGSVTLITSIWNLTTDHKPKDPRTSWNLYSLPMQNKTMAMGISYSFSF